MKKVKNKNKKLLYVTIGTTMILVAMIGLLGWGLARLVASVKPDYKIDSRVENVEAYAAEHADLPVKGWIKIEGTDIDYPIVFDGQGINVHDPSKDFLWMANDVNELTNMVFVLGHNIRNVSKHPLIKDPDHTEFEQLPSFMYLDFAKKNEYIQYTIDGQDYLYKIFSVSIVNDDKLNYQTGNLTKEKLRQYITESLSDSYYKYDVDVNENDNILALTTCTRFFGVNSDYALKVDARMVRDNEKVKDYSVIAKSNYKEVEKMMKEGVENEGNA